MRRALGAKIMTEEFDRLLDLKSSEVDEWICANIFGPAVELDGIDHENQLELLQNWADKARPECRSYLAWFPVNFFSELQYDEVVGFYDYLATRATCEEELEGIRNARSQVLARSQ